MYIGSNIPYLKRVLLTRLDGKTLHHLAVDSEAEYVIGNLVIFFDRSRIGLFVQYIQIVTFHGCRASHDCTVNDTHRLLKNAFPNEHPNKRRWQRSICQIMDCRREKSMRLIVRYLWGGVCLVFKRSDFLYPLNGWKQMTFE